MPQHGVRDHRRPGSGGVGEGPRRDRAAVATIDHREPPGIGSIGADTTRSGPDRRATFGGIERREHHQAGIVGDAVPICERQSERTLQCVADRMMRDVECRRGRQAAAAGEAVVKEQAGTQQPWRTLIRMRRNDELHRTDQVRRDPKPGPALGQSPPHPPEAAALQHREIAVDQPRCRR